MRPFVEGLSDWGAAHLATAPSRFELVAPSALVALAVAFFVYLAAQGELVSRWGMVTVFALMVGLLFLQTAALRLAHHRFLQKLR